MADYSNLPSRATLKVVPFKAHVEEEKLQHFKQLLALSPIAPVVFENTNADRKYGIRRDWLVKAKDKWLNDFEWRRCEDRINSFPNFVASLQDDDGNNVEIQFLALFSEREDAIPVAFFHGWPGSCCEFLDVLELLTERYSPRNLPYHVVVPCLPGYGYSSGPPIAADYSIEQAADVMHNLMIGLGFGSGYLVQGGDLGSFVSRTLALKYDACKGMHLDMMVPHLAEDGLPTSDAEIKVLQKAAEMMDTGYAYGFEQGTRPATLGFALSASPLSLLSWIGEKLLEWTEVDPPLERILESVTLYWMTDTIARGLYHSRQLGSAADEKPRIARRTVMAKGQALPFIGTPSGYSMFAYNIIPTPRSMAERSCNLVWFNQHERGGHFPAMERPEEFLDDVEDFVKTAWNAVAEST